MATNQLLTVYRPETSAIGSRFGIRDNGSGIRAGDQGEDLQSVLYDEATPAKEPALAFR